MPVLETIPITEPWLGQTERRLVDECVSTGWVSSQGKFVGEFERLFAAYCGVKHGVATSSGTSALHLALASLGIGAGDEVIVPTLSFVATANVVTYVGAKPVFVDSSRETWNLDPKAMERAVTVRTRAIIPVHLYGQPAQMDEILSVAERYGLHIIEDACQAHGAEYRGQKVGSLGTIGCFSFYGNKIITTGEGGMLVTDNLSIAENARMLRDHGMSRNKRYWHPQIGFNYRMTNLQAALGVAQIERINEFIERKRKNAQLYRSLLERIPGITLPPDVPWARGVYWLYTILIGDEFKLSRDSIMAEMDHRGIETRPVFYPIHTMAPYFHFTNQRFRTAEQISKNGLSLPSSPLLKVEQIHRICNLIRELTRPSSAVSVQRVSAISG